MNKLIDYIFNQLASQFNDRLRIREKRPGIYQLYLPFYHEDGDMVEVYLDGRKRTNEVTESEVIRISDFGMTAMRLSYAYEIDTPNKEKIFSQILSENQICEVDGHIVYDTPIDSIYPSLMHFCQAIAKVSTMRQFKREVVDSLFYEQLDNFIMGQLIAYNPMKNVTPIPERDDLEVDYQFTPNGHPVYLFGIKDAYKARLATISCLEFVLKNHKFKSFIVHDDFEKLPKKDRTRLTSASDKQFPSLEDFNKNAKTFLEREATY